MEGIEAIIYRAYPEDARILRKHVDDKESEIRNLRQQLEEKDAELAKCVEVIVFARKCFCKKEDLIDVVWKRFDTLLDSLQESAKKDAEILRCAKAYYEEHKDFLMTPEQDDGTHEVEIAFVEAVRAREKS